MTSWDYAYSAPDARSVTGAAPLPSSLNRTAVPSRQSQPDATQGTIGRQSDSTGNHPHPASPNARRAKPRIPIVATVSHSPVHDRPAPPNRARPAPYHREELSLREDVVPCALP